MNEPTRFILAQCRLAALGDVRSWTTEDLLDVAALAPRSGIGFEQWRQALGAAPAQEVAPAEEQPIYAKDGELVTDLTTSETMEAILAGKHNEHAKNGVFSLIAIHEDGREEKIA